jgi:non-canonical poly(A) RNA polymerase PAPD5/7
MNETYSGGIGSFVLTMMIVSFLQMKQRQCAVPTRTRNGGGADGNDPADGGPQALPTPSWNLGTLLLEFFHLYGVSFNYYSAGISITEGGSYLVKRKRSKESNNGRYGVTS